MELSNRSEEDSDFVIIVRNNTIVAFTLGGPNQALRTALSQRDNVLNFYQALIRSVAVADQPHTPIPEAMLAVCTPTAGDACTICLEEFGAAGSTAARWVSLVRCNHRFHANCIRRWEYNTCPNCRAVQE
jgi:hypothetical protein